jgi:hypothetical protein
MAAFDIRRGKFCTNRVGTHIEGNALCALFDKEKAGRLRAGDDEGTQKDMLEM